MTFESASLSDICICSKYFPQVIKTNLSIGKVEVLWKLAGT